VDVHRTECWISAPLDRTDESALFGPAGA